MSGPTNEFDRNRIGLENAVARLLMAADEAHPVLLRAIQEDRVADIRASVAIIRHLEHAKRHIAEMHPNGRKEMRL